MRTRKELERAVIEKYRKCAKQWGISESTAEKRAKLLMPYNSDDNLRTFLRRPNKTTSTNDLDPGHRAADEEIAKMSRKVHKVYTRAAKEMEQKVSKHLEQFEVADGQMKDQLDSGQISEQDYKNWRERNMIQGRQWEQMRDVLADDASRSNDIARDIVNGHMSDIYAENYNFGTYQVEHAGRIDTSFTLYDKDTVNRLLRENPQLLPSPGKKTMSGLAKGKDRRWNRNHIQAELLQGILQGESIPNIAKRLRNVETMNEKASIRYARTMTTGAENAGRSDSWDRAQKMGVKSDMAWMATLDGRTRDSHRALDGEVRNRKTGKFSNGCRYPGDPQGKPGEVYNCRCTVVYQLKGFENDFSDLSWRPTKALGDMSYDEWKQGKKREKAQKIDRESTIKEILGGKAASKFTDIQKKEFGTILGNMDDNQLKLYHFMSGYHDNNDYYKKHSGWYAPLKHKVEMDINELSWEKQANKNDHAAWKVKFHEELHQLDSAMGERQSRYGTITRAEPSAHTEKGMYGDRLANAINSDIIDFVNKSVDETYKKDMNNFVSSGVYDNLEEAEQYNKKPKHLKSLEKISTAQKNAVWDYLETQLDTDEKKAYAGAFTDAMGLATKGRLNAYAKGYWGHTTKYQKDRGINGATSECWAEIGSHILRHDDKALSTLKKFMPKSVSEYQKCLEDVVNHIGEVKNGK